jgi:hypothetical protein
MDASRDSLRMNADVRFGWWSLGMDATLYLFERRWSVGWIKELEIRKAATVLVR